MGGKSAGRLEAEGAGIGPREAAVFDCANSCANPGKLTVIGCRTFLQEFKRQHFARREMSSVFRLLVGSKILVLGGVSLSTPSRPPC